MDKKLIVEKIKAMSVHFGFSLLLAILALYLVFKVWYPSPIDYAMGVGYIFVMMLAIDLVIGPILTFIIFNRQKKELKVDLSIIVSLQLLAFTYGMFNVAQGRAVWMTFVIDDVELIRAVDIDVQEGESILPEYESHLFQKPRWAGTQFSSDPKIAEAQKDADLLGHKLSTRPTYYEPLSNRKADILASLRNINELNGYNDSSQVRTILLNYQNKNIVGYLPVKGYEKDVVALFDNKGNPVGIVKLNPWK